MPGGVYEPIGPGSGGASSGGGGGGSPGTPLGSIQYNKAGAFGGVANYSSDGTNIFTDEAAGGPVNSGPYEGEIFLLANADITLTVDPAGSDTTGDGSVGNPYATPQHALNVCAQFDYLETYRPTVNINAGTYVLGGTLTLPVLRNIGATSLGTIQGADAATVILQGPSGNIALLGNGPACIWNLDGVTIDSDTCCIQMENMAEIFPGDGSQETVNFQDSSNGGGCDIFRVFAGGFVSCVFMNITCNNTFETFVVAGGATGSGGGAAYALFVGLGNTITIPATPAFGSEWINSSFQGPSFVQWAFGNAVTNETNFTGLTVKGTSSGGCLLETDNAALTDFPGSGSAVDNQVYINAPFASPVITGSFLFQNAGIFDNTQVPQDTWLVQKDTTGGGVYVVANDGGTIKKVALT